MKAKELKELLKDVPDDAEVYIEADHGQSPEQASFVNYGVHATKDLEDEKFPYYGDDLRWSAEQEEWANEDNEADIKVTPEEERPKKATAILIS